MSWRLPRCGAPSASSPCSPGSSVGAEPRSRGPSVRVSLVAALASLLGGISPLAVPPALLLGATSLFTAAPAKAQTVPTNVLTNGVLDVTNLAVTPGDEKLDLMWFASSGGGTHWWVQYKRQTDTAWTTSTSTLAWTNTSHSITGLTGGTLYDVRVFGTTTGGGTTYRGIFATDSGTPTATSTSNNLSATQAPPETGVELESAAFLDSSEGYHDLVIPEGGSATFGVRLTAVPAANTTVNLMKLVAQQFHGNFNAVTVSPTTLTFTPSNYSTLQTVTVTGVADDDADHEHVIVAAQIAGGKYLANGVYVTVSDDGGAVQVGVQPAIVREIDNQLVAEYGDHVLAQPCGIQSSDGGRQLGSRRHGNGGCGLRLDCVDGDLRAGRDAQDGEVSGLRRRRGGQRGNVLCGAVEPDGRNHRAGL